ncbi:5' nucleotidase, deoxy (Pyrimidine), cytosolic type C protein (NT5C) [Planctomycetes bacterium Pan216]|uniref:5' nucleotidase, deoxy (Pyrimidine), cytosolic type C protein (NT5C) n=1 Tax=Kolteria novifilia TaxID=2527975 RepID=A0A518B8E4_9BACT|nr:5' nucleotidase, deoxy (Pyrimidine), cytosolic type C protein (NT5C) [Planctomycetes bacterium Pan216]
MSSQSDNQSDIQSDDQAINIALFDMDGTLADYHDSMVRELARLSCPTEPVIDLDQNSPPDYLRARMDLIKARPGWWYGLEPLKSGFDILRVAENVGFDIHILTKAPRNHSLAWKEKVEWCSRHLGPDTNVHITQDKGMVYGTVLVDDTPDFMLRWLRWRPRGLGIMPVASYNAAFSHPSVIRYDGTNLDEVEEALQRVKRR